MNRIERNGDFLAGELLKVLGDIHTEYSNSCSIMLKLKQAIPIIPTPTMNFLIYKSNVPYKRYTANDNVSSDMTLHASITLDVYNTSEYISEIRSDCKYMFFQLNNPEGLTDALFHLSVHTNDFSIDNCKVRDKVLELEDECLLVRNVGDYKTEIQAQQHKGMTAWSMSAKGDLTNTEYLLYDDAINTLGFFNTSDYSHSAEQIIVKSTSSSDDISGIGGRVLEVNGLDGNFNEITEECFLDGTTEVYLSTHMTEINSIIVKSSGGLFCNAGTITAYNSTGGSTNPQATITMNAGIHHNSQYCVPLGYTLIIHKINVVSHAEDECELIFNRYNWDTRINKHRLKTFHLHSNNAWEGDVSFNIMEKERFTITAQVATAPTGINRVSCNVFGYLKKNDFISGSSSSYNSQTFISKH